MNNIDRQFLVDHADDGKPVYCGARSLDKIDRLVRKGFVEIIKDYRVESGPRRAAAVDVVVTDAGRNIIKGARHNPGKYRVRVKQSGSPLREMIAVHGQDYQWYDLDGSPLETGGAYVQEMLEEVELADLLSEHSPVGFSVAEVNPMEKLIKVSYETITSESAEEGEVEDTGWIDEDGEDMAPDEYDEEEGITAVDKAVEFLRDEGVSEPSASRFHKGVWYTAYGEQDPYSGEVENKSYHLHGFTEDEQRKIFEAMTSRRNPTHGKQNPSSSGPPAGWHWPSSGSIEVLDTLNDTMVQRQRFDGDPERFHGLLKKYGRYMNGNEPRYTVQLLNDRGDVRVDNGGIGGTLRYTHHKQNPSSPVQYEADLSKPSHIEEVRLRGNTATLYRFGRPITSFTPSPAQKKKIMSRTGKLRITQDMINKAEAALSFGQPPATRLQELYRAAEIASDEWQRELEREFGRRASEMRYRPEGEGKPGTSLRAAHDRMVEAKPIRDSDPVTQRFLKTGSAIRNPPSDIDHHAATELKIYIDNDAQLYRQRKKPIELNLSKKWKKGTYDEALAAKAYMYLVDDGAKKYAKDYGGTWNQMFTPATRREVARQFAEEFTAEARLGNLTENPRVSGGRQNPSLVKYEADLSAPSHIEEVRLSGNTTTLYRFGRPVVSFTPSPAQKKKIASGKGKLRITSDMVTTGHGYPGLQKRNPITQADHTPFGWKEEPAQPELLEREDGLGLTLPLARSTLNLLAAYNDGEAPTLKPEEVFQNINYNNKFDVLGLYEGTYAQDIGSLVTFSQDGSGPVAEYLNVGDPYIPTVLYDYEQDQFYITGWGDWLAKWEEEHREDREDYED